LIHTPIDDLIVGVIDEMVRLFIYCWLIRLFIWSLVGRLID